MLKVISGSSNPMLAEDIKDYIRHKTNDSFELVGCVLDKFKDGELKVQIQENMRGVHVFVIQSLSNPVNDNLIELSLILDALKRCNVQETTVVLPYYGYSRQDRKDSPRSPISAKVVADILQISNMSRIVTIDLHAPQIQGFFDCPMDNLYAFKVLLEQIENREDLVFVSPDKGGVEKSVQYATTLNKPVTFCYKHRDKSGQINDMRLIGEVNNKHCVMIDDMICSAGTIIKAANILEKKGATGVEVYATHGIFSGDSINKLSESCIERVNITDTIALPKEVLTNQKFNVISVSEMIADCILNIFERRSVSKLFN